MAENPALQELWGGAIVASLPSSFRDISKIRQVPDHQECWQDVDRGVLLVIEILERQPVEDDEAAAYYFHDLCNANECLPQDCSFQNMTDLYRIYNLPPGAVTRFGVGFQRVRLGRELHVAMNPIQQEERALRIELCVIRLPSHTTDLLISCSSPCDSNPQETVTSSDCFRQVISSIQIRDLKLFGDA